MLPARLLQFILMLDDRPLSLEPVLIPLSVQFDFEECLHGLGRLLFPDSPCKMLEALFGLRQNVNLVLETLILALGGVHHKGRHSAAIVDPDAAKLNDRVLARIVVQYGCVEVAVGYLELVFVHLQSVRDLLVKVLFTFEIGRQ